MDKTPSPLTAAILVVSTTAAQGLSADASGPLLRQVLSEDGGKWTISHESVVPDDVLLVQKNVLAWAADPSPPSLILTTGGTGFATADSTPEVTGLGLVYPRCPYGSWRPARPSPRCFISRLPAWCRPCWPPPCP